jgi:hypothetical protein
MATQPKFRKKLKYGKKRETFIQEDIIKFLKQLPNCHVENVWGRANSKGQSDIKGCIQGRYFVFEIKTDEGDPTDEQLIYITHLKGCGAIAAVVRNLNEVKEILTHHGYL